MPVRPVMRMPPSFKALPLLRMFMYDRLMLAVVVAEDAAVGHVLDRAAGLRRRPCP